ncbi:hypothetical protein V8D89_009861, partial [Ganoderma adspersum]
SRSGRILPTAVLLCLTILILFTSTTIYMITCINFYHSASMSDFIDAAAAFWSYEPCDFTWVIPHNINSLFTRDTLVLGCASAGSLTINVTLGDAIVCWRVCVVWHKNHTVKAICGTFSVATVGKLLCHLLIYIHKGSGIDFFPGNLFEGIPIGIAACVLSLSTNILATCLVSCKVWYSRRRLKGYFMAKIGGSPVEKLLTLLVESGAIYSAIWSVIVAFQVRHYRDVNSLRLSTQESSFLDYFGVMMNGGLIPAIAIYPTIIIVLVALNKSHMEGGISQHLESVPT